MESFFVQNFNLRKSDDIVFCPEYCCQNPVDGALTTADIVCLGSTDSANWNSLQIELHNLLMTSDSYIKEDSVKIQNKGK